MNQRSLDWHLLSSILFVALAEGASAATISLRHRLFDPATDGAAGTRHGSAAPLEAGWLAVGAPNNDTGANDAGERPVVLSC